MRKLVVAALVAVCATAAPSAFGQTLQSGVLDIYGDDKCPTNSNGEEIVICRRLDESERFRVPKDLREAEVKAKNQAWAVRQQSALAEGASGIGSCSAVGAGGSSGCFVRETRAAVAEARGRKAEAETIPLP